ncbi:hemoglobin subunit beta-like [Salmo salar]|uniref:Hemoglobin subunit beta-like n=1 Tax=Salmo salar TaxID=8030 RepID=A0A1S3S589_SALSA|nr:hemoglobin subunit beta-like [Salmo salar]|eukprot:XP_014059464.1 PREDICTED: hemoglobin subunit beta-like [Salmo salar]
MVEWTDFERATIQSIFSKMDYDDVGPAALSKYTSPNDKIIYFWALSVCIYHNAAAIQGNPMVAAHGKTVLHGLDRAVKNLDDIKATYAELSVLHSEKRHVDPDNFRLLADCLTIVVAARMGADFTADVQGAFQKFLAVVVSSLGKQYH